MLKVLVGTFLTLDGVYQAPGFADEDTEGGFKHGGWQMPYFSEDAGKIIDGQMAGLKALLLGRKTYQIFAGYWPTATDDPEMAKRMNNVPKFVASRTLKTVEWKNSSIMSGSLVEGVNKARQIADSGTLSVIGSGNLVQSLLKENLVDEYSLWIHPLVLGSGRRLFDGGVIPTDLKLIDSTTTSAGVVLLRLVPEKK